MAVILWRYTLSRNLMDVAHSDFSETHVMRDKFFDLPRGVVARNPVCCYPYSPTYCIYREFYMTGRQDIVVSDDQIQVVVNRQNSQRPQQLYRNLQRLGIRNVHFIPLLEHDRNGMLTEDSLCSADWGRFLNSVFDIWVREDIQRISVRLF